MRIEFVQDIIDLLRNKKSIADVIRHQVEYQVPYVEPKSTYQKLICLTGFGHSGSGALLDYLAEFNKTTVLGYHDVEYTGIKEEDSKISELDFIRCAGSVMDIEHALNHGNYFNEDLVVNQFLTLAEYFYRKGIIYTDKYWELTNKFVEKIIELKIPTKWGFEGLYYYTRGHKEGKYFNLFAPMVCAKSKKPYIYYLKDMPISEYRKIAKEYILSFLKTIESEEFLVLDQALTTSKAEIEKKIDYFGDFKAIYVYRDPRDVYCTARKTQAGWMPQNPQDFVKWFYKRGTPYWLKEKHPNLLGIRFEDLVLNYDETTKKVNEFLGINSQDHIHKKEYFNPEISKQNIKMYENYENQDEIEYIYKELKQYCCNN